MSGPHIIDPTIAAQLQQASTQQAAHAQRVQILVMCASHTLGPLVAEHIAFSRQQIELKVRSDANLSAKSEEDIVAEIESADLAVPVDHLVDLAMHCGETLMNKCGIKIKVNAPSQQPQE